MTDFRALFRELDDHNVEFILIGGVAATVHGSSRLTQDIDIVYRRSPENVERLVKALRPHRPYLRDAAPGLPFQWDPATVQRGLNFTLTTNLGEIDLFGEIVGGGQYEDLLGHTVRITLFGISALCLDLPQLIRVKRAAGRARDLESVAELEALLEEKS